MNKKKIAIVIIIVLYSTLIWSKAISFDFFNDDYQILGHLAENSSNPFKVFVEKDVSEVYFRPIPNFLLSSILLSFGYQPFWFHLYLFLLHIFLILSFYLFLKKLFNDFIVIAWSLLFFSILPSHDIYLVWIASSGDLLATIFVILFFVFHFEGKTMLSFAFAILAFLSKESTLTLPLLTFFLAFLNKDNFARYFKLSVGLVSIILVKLGYQILILRANPFETSNLANFDWLSIPSNFLLTIVAPFFPTSFPKGIHSTLSLATILLLLATIVFAFLQLKKSLFESNNPTQFRTCLFGLLWFVVFSLPTLPLFMRWYSLLPSIGLFILFTDLTKQAIHRKSALMGLVLIFLLFSVQSFVSISFWYEGNRYAQNVLNKIKSTQFGKENVLLWFFPEYYRGYFILRSGVEQAIKFNANQPIREVLIPISTEIEDEINIETTTNKENFFEFKISGATPYVGKRKYGNIDSTFVENDYYWCKIKSEMNYYCVQIQFKQKKPQFENYIYNGNFVPFF